MSSNVGSSGDVAASARVLGCPELLSLVLESFSISDLLEDVQVDSKQRRREHRATLASCARVCRTFFDQALDVLWNTSDNLLLLLLLFPTFGWAQEHYVCDIKHFYSCAINRWPSIDVCWRSRSGVAPLSTLRASCAKAQVLCRRNHTSICVDAPGPKERRLLSSAEPAEAFGHEYYVRGRRPDHPLVGAKHALSSPRIR